jgi:hypothetical protein
MANDSKGRRVCAKSCATPIYRYQYKKTVLEDGYEHLRLLVHKQDRMNTGHSVGGRGSRLLSTLSLVASCFAVLACASPEQVKDWESQRQAKAKQAEAQATALTSKLKKISEEHPDWPSHIRVLVARGDLLTGMNREQVIASWGRPQDIQRTRRGALIHEEWVYRRTLPTSYGVYDQVTYRLYFQDGILTGWHD